MIRPIKHALVDATLAATRAAGLSAAPILMYHAVDARPSDLTVPPDQFREQMHWLRDHGFRTVSLDEYADALLGPGLKSLGRAAVVTFDDGYVNNLEHAVPALAEMNFTATLFIPTGCVGGTTAWLDEQWPVMSWGQIGECVSAGMSIGAHTVNHPRLSRIPSDEAKREMTECKAALEEHLGQSVGWMCYPYGDHSRAVEDLARAIGFRGAVSVAQSNTNISEDLFRLRRFYIGPTTDLRHFAMAMSRLWTWKHGGGEGFES